jgi:carbon-monoxide dehydrogenase medium subunit
VRNAATVGGCVAAASPFFDLPVAFMALDGVVGARGSNGIREIDIEALYLGLFENSLQQTEFIVSVTLPRMPAGSASAFVKFASNANDLAIVSAAARVTVDASGRCTDARVVIGGGVANRPWRSRAAEGVLQGATLGTDTLEAAGDAAASDVEPLSDHRASGRYRKAVAGVLVRRALTAALARVP